MKNFKKLFCEDKPKEFGGDCVMFLDTYENDKGICMRKIYAKKSAFEKFSMLARQKPFIRAKYAPRLIVNDTEMRLEKFERKYHETIDCFEKCAIYRNSKEFICNKDYNPLSLIGNNHLQSNCDLKNDYIKYEEKNLYLKFYRCGQASISSLHDGDKILAVFDLGSMHKRNTEIVSLFRNLKKATNRVYFIISHFDSDHINLIKKLYLNEKENFVFIVHECLLNNLNPSYRALIEMLRHSKCKIIVLQQGKNLKNNLFEIRPSKIVPGSTLTKENQTSLCVHITLNERRYCFPGDAMYENFPFEESYTHILIPHHGAYTNHPVTNPTAEAFVYAGHNKKYKHPRREHLVQYKNKILRFDENDNGMIFDARGEVKDDICKILYKNSKKCPLK